MSHTDKIKDADAFFEVNPITRQIINKTPTKVVLMQNDHNSERFTFRLPRFIEGHDMAESATARLEYKNEAVGTVGLYEMRDLAIDPENEENVICSWLISRNATANAGAISFSIEFECYENDKLVYSWHTMPHKGISVGATFSGTEEIEEHYPDILAQIKEDILKFNAMLTTVIDDGANDKTFPTTKAVKDYVDTGLDDCACKIVDSAEGVKIPLNDNDYRAIEGLIVYGKTKQKATPSISNPQELLHGRTVVHMYYSSNTININIPGGLAGVPVANGGNYTDDKGQQWVADFYDYDTLQHTQRVRTVILDKSGGGFKRSGLATYDGYYYFYRGVGSSVDINYDGVICDRLPTKHYSTAWTDNVPGEFCTLKPSIDGTSVVFCVNILKSRVDKFPGNTVAEKFNNFIAENPLTIQLAHRNAISSTGVVLTEEEKAQYKEFKLIAPFTTVYNDMESYMEIKYVVDTKAYIDKKIKAALN